MPAKKTKTVKSPEAPKTQERQLEKLTEAMIKEMSAEFRKQAIQDLSAGAVEQFEDAAPSYAKIFLRLAERTRSKLLSKFDNAKIEKLVGGVLGKVNKRNQSELYNRVEKQIGISTTELTKNEDLLSEVDALNLETSQWVKKLRDETLELYTANTLAAMAQGKSLAEILEQFDGMVEKRKNHAKFTARNQIGNFNSLTTKIRAQNLGITQAIWRTSRDERVRPCHHDRRDKTFDLDKGLYSSCDQKWLLPGVDFQCRCDYELIIPED